MQAKHLQQVIERDIPLAKAMDLTVCECQPGSIRLSAPLDKNRNHQNSAFGGSLFSLAVLSGWCLLLERLDAHQLAGNIVIQDSEIKYLLPVRGELSATCQLESEQQWQRLVKMIQHKGLGRIRLNAAIWIEKQLAVEFSGHYVVHRMNQPEQREN